MRELVTIYPARFFEKRLPLRWVSELMAKMILQVYQPSSVLDVGCANGVVVRELLDANVDAYGVEGSADASPFFEVPERILELDLRFPVAVEGAMFDLVLSTEVAEHIEPEHAETFLDTLAAFGDRILLTAAPPGQGGTYHVNCQPRSYWIGKLAARGFNEDLDALERCRKVLLPFRTHGEVCMYYENCMCFERHKDSA